MISPEGLCPEDQRDGLAYCVHEKRADIIPKRGKCEAQLGAAIPLKNLGTWW